MRLIPNMNDNVWVLGRKFQDLVAAAIHYNVPWHVARRLKGTGCLDMMPKLSKRR